MNLIRRQKVPKEAKSNAAYTLIIRGITKEPMQTLGSVNIKMLGEDTEFHILPDSFALPSDGILGTSFFEQHNATIDYGDRAVHCDTITIPFFEQEIVECKARTVMPLHAVITNPEVKTGYLPFQKFCEGVYFGDDIVTNSQGRAYLEVFNTTDNDLDLVVPHVELVGYDNAHESLYRGMSESRNGAHSLEAMTPQSPVEDSNQSYEDQELLNLSTNSATGARPNSNLVTPCGPHRGEDINDVVAKTLGLSATAGLCNSSISRSDQVIKLLRLNHLNLEEKQEVKELIGKHANQFYLPGEQLKITNSAEYTIATSNEIPVHTKQYRFPPIHKEEIDKQVGSLMNNDIIDTSNSTYHAPLWIVPKKPDSSGNKKWRVVIDYRLLNEKTIGDAYPLPNISDILDQLGSAKYFSVLDLAFGFHQIPMAKRDAAKTAFSTPYGHFQFKRMPFGLKNAPATF